MINKIIEYFGKKSITTSEINTFKSRMKLYKVNQKKKIKNPEYGKRVSANNGFIKLKK